MYRARIQAGLEDIEKIYRQSQDSRLGAMINQSNPADLYDLLKNDLIKEAELIGIVSGLFAAVAVGPLLTPSDLVLEAGDAEYGAGSATVKLSTLYAFMWASSFGFHGASVIMCT